MDMIRAMELRHAVRSFKKEPLTPEQISTLQAKMKEFNKEYGLHFSLQLNEPKALGGLLGKIGGFKNAVNYITVAGPKGNETTERLGYCGEYLVLLAQTLGLNTCWIAGTYSLRQKSKLTGKQEQVRGIIAIGKGETQGNPHVNKNIKKINLTENGADWYQAGIRAVMLAPTSMNRQQFTFRQSGEREVTAKTNGNGMLLLDLGIAKLHFELGAGKENFRWA